MTNIEQIQQPYDWDNAPIICEFKDTKWILGPEAPEVMTWYDAIEWCQTVGGELPPRNILLEAYMNEDIRKEFFATSYWSSTELSATSYWSSTELSATNAWYQDFGYGGQYNDTKISVFYARAVLSIKIGE